MTKDFENHLRKLNLADNTITSYSFAVKQFYTYHPTVTQKNLRAHKVWLTDHYKPKTVNLRLRAINSYLEYLGCEKWKLSSIRIQQKTFLENVISEADYEYFKTCLKNDHELFWYFVIRFMAATGVRVSELVQIKAEHVTLGHLDLYSKGGKLRRIYFPKNAAGRSALLACVQEARERFHFSKSTGTPNHDPWNLLSVKETGCPISYRSLCCLSALFPPSICKKFLERV